MVNRLKLLEQFPVKKLDVRIRNVCSRKGFSILKEKIAKYRGTDKIVHTTLPRKKDKHREKNKSKSESREREKKKEKKRDKEEKKNDKRHQEKEESEKRHKEKKKLKTENRHHKERTEMTNKDLMVKGRLELNPYYGYPGGGNLQTELRSIEDDSTDSSEAKRAKKSFKIPRIPAASQVLRARQSPKKIKSSNPSPTARASVPARLQHSNSSNPTDLSPLAASFCFKEKISTDLTSSEQFKLFTQTKLPAPSSSPCFTFTPTADAGALTNKRYSVDKVKDAEDLQDANIHDPEWDFLKSKRNDNDRVAVSREIFPNPVPADPLQDLTYHGFWRRRHEDDEMRRKMDFAILPRNSFNLEDGVLKPLPGFIKENTKKKDEVVVEKPVEVNPVSQIDLSKITDPRVLKFLRTNEIFDNPDDLVPIAQYKEIVFKRYVENYDKSRKHVQADLRDDKKQLGMFLAHFNESCAEIENFLGFYQQPGEVGLTKRRVKDMLDAENQFSAFPTYYSARQKLLCKPCRTSHWHSI